MELPSNLASTPLREDLSPCFRAMGFRCWVPKLSPMPASRLAIHVTGNPQPTIIKRPPSDELTPTPLGRTSAS